MVLRNDPRTSPPPDGGDAAPDDEGDMALVARALTGLRFGACVISVHGGRIVQVARTEKLRPPRSRP